MPPPCLVVPIVGPGDSHHLGNHASLGGSSTLSTEIENVNSDRFKVPLEEHLLCLAFLLAVRSGARIAFPLLLNSWNIQSKDCVLVSAVTLPSICQ